MSATLVAEARDFETMGFFDRAIMRSFNPEKLKRLEESARLCRGLGIDPKNPTVRIVEDQPHSPWSWLGGR